VPYAKSQKYSEIEHIAKGIWLGRYSRDNVMGLLSAAYFDASGKQKGYSFLTVAGAVSPIKKWIRFGLLENKELAETIAVCIRETALPQLKTLEFLLAQQELERPDLEKSPGFIH
jgi:hypothetical protein